MLFLKVFLFVGTGGNLIVRNSLKVWLKGVTYPKKEVWMYIFPVVKLKMYVENAVFMRGEVYYKDPFACLSNVLNHS